MSTERYLGIDIGGTNAKFGVVTRAGELEHKVKYPTVSLIDGNNFTKKFGDALGEQLDQFPTIKKVGIGIPGLLSKDRKSTIRSHNISALNNTNVIDTISNRFPKCIFKMENDANVAALGEYYFAEKPLSENFLMVTLGTGVGGAAIIDGEIFSGADGNGLEIGHAICGKNTTVENVIGKKGIIEYAYKVLNKTTEYSLLRGIEDLDAKQIAKAALKNDIVGTKVFKRVGKILGQCLVSTIRILDIKTIVIGGGVAETYEIIQKPMTKELEKYLPSYYLDHLQIEKASLKNEAGIIGAASLCFKD